MKLDNIGEFDLIKRLTQGLKKDTSIIKGVGDDTAVVKYKNDTCLVITTDILIEDVHFKIKEAPAYLIGSKSLACNISDIASMAARPKYAVISLGLPKRSTFEFVKSLYKGIERLADKNKIKIIGGDTSASAKLVINITLLGFANSKDITYRHNAKINDRIFATGTLGGASKGKHLRFKPRLNEALSLVRKYKINSMIDISDGLVSDLNQILTSSKKGALIYEDKIPVSKNAKSLKQALYEGEDFELLFTINEKQAERLKKSPIRGFKITQIGRIVNKNKGFKIIDKEGKVKKVSLKYIFRHF